MSTLHLFGTSHTQDFLHSPTQAGMFHCLLQREQSSCREFSCHEAQSGACSVSLVGHNKSCFFTSLLVRLHNSAAGSFLTRLLLFCWLWICFFYKTTHFSPQRSLSSKVSFLVFPLVSPAEFSHSHAPVIFHQKRGTCQTLIHEQLSSLFFKKLGLLNTHQCPAPNNNNLLGAFTFIK